MTSDAPGDAPIPKLPWATVCRLLRNLDYGRPVDPDGWRLPDLRALPADDPDVALARRLADAFYHAMDAGGGAGDGLWHDMRDAFHGPFIRALEARDFQTIAETLAGMFYAPVTAGICRRERDPEAFAGDLATRLITVDVVASLGMALGVTRVPNPFVPDPPNPLAFDAAAVMAGIREALGGDFAPPQVGAIFGIEFDGRLYPHKYLYQVYTAHRMRTIIGPAFRSCLEIGGGMGFLAYAAVVVGGVRDYCIVDLPIINMLQGYLLLKSSLADCVALYGETPPRAGGTGRRIRILPDMAIRSLRSRSFDMAVNQDSLPEMTAATMERYLDEIERLTRAGFLSINHESGQTVASGFSHGVVGEAVGRRPAFQRVYRMPYWLRPGYVEELYRMTGRGSLLERLGGCPRL